MNNILSDNNLPVHTNILMDQNVVEQQVEQQVEQHVEQHVEQKKVILFGLPGNSYSSQFLISWTNTFSYLLKTGLYDIIIAPGVSSFVSFARMSTLGLNVLNGIDQKPINGTHFDIWITIDSDIIFTPEQVIQLIEGTDKHSVVSGLYRMSDLQHFAVVKEWDTNYFLQNGSFEFLTQDYIDNWKKETSLKYMPVNYTGLGFFACKKEVLYKMQYPYFDGELHEINVDSTKIIRDISGEDVNFCKNIVKAGYEIILDTDLRVGHLKQIII